MYINSVGLGSVLLGIGSYEVFLTCAQGRSTALLVLKTALDFQSSYLKELVASTCTI